MTDLPPRNFLDGRIRTPMPCGRCKGTGLLQSVGGPRRDPWCPQCRGSGVLTPDPPADPDPAN